MAVTQIGDNNNCDQTSANSSLTVALFSAFWFSQPARYRFPLTQDRALILTPINARHSRSAKMWLTNPKTNAVYSELNAAETE